MIHFDDNDGNAYINEKYFQTSKLIIFYVKIIVVSDFFINFAC